MTQLIEQVGGWIEELIAAIGYPGIVLVMAIENIFPPIPSEAVLPFAGSLSAKGELDFWGAVAAGTDWFSCSVRWFCTGSAILRGRREFGRLVESYGKYVFISEKDLDRGAAWFERYGEAVILFGRLIPLVRSIVSVPAGYTRMHFGRFLFFTTLGTALWSLVLTFAGRLLGENWEEIAEFMEPYQNGTLVVLVLVIVVAFIGWRA